MATIISLSQSLDFCTSCRLNKHQFTMIFISRVSVEQRNKNSFVQPYIFNYFNSFWLWLASYLFLIICVFLTVVLFITMFVSERHHVKRVTAVAMKVWDNALNLPGGSNVQYAQGRVCCALHHLLSVLLDHPASHTAMIGMCIMQCIMLHAAVYCTRLALTRLDLLISLLEAKVHQHQQPSPGFVYKNDSWQSVSQSSRFLAIQNPFLSQRTLDWKIHTICRPLFCDLHVVHVLLGAK